MALCKCPRHSCGAHLCGNGGVAVVLKFSFPWVSPISQGEPPFLTGLPGAAASPLSIPLQFWMCCIQPVPQLGPSLLFPGPFCCSGLWECSTELFQEVQSAGWVCLSVCLCLLPFPTAPFLAGEELLSSGHLHLGNPGQFSFLSLNCSAVSDVPLICRAPQTAGLSQGSVSCCHRAFCCRQLTLL